MQVYTAAVVVLGDPPSTHSLIGESSDTTYSSGPSKFATFTMDLCKIFVSAGILL
jgi:hypothetical protein